MTARTTTVGIIIVKTSMGCKQHALTLTPCKVLHKYLLLLPKERTRNIHASTDSDEMDQLSVLGKPISSLSRNHAFQT